MIGYENDEIPGTFYRDSIPNMIDFALKIILAIIVYYIGTKVIKWICRLFQKFALKRQME